jgi:sec-independent protein translocase protein TatA
VYRILNLKKPLKYKDMAGRLGVTEILLIVAVLLLFFGGKKIPEFMKGLGEGMREFKKAAKGDDEPNKGSEVQK